MLLSIQKLSICCCLKKMSAFLVTKSFQKVENKLKIFRTIFFLKHLCFIIIFFKILSHEHVYICEISIKFFVLDNPTWPTQLKTKFIHSFNFFKLLHTRTYSAFTRTFTQKWTVSLWKGKEYLNFLEGKTTWTDGMTRGT